ncbi:hypothetical protein SCH01S_10_00320 [Sphingomonas changbaiensis NBRC 104936]|uniref:Spondin domain-containing protein n=1 Tax=Sphingomonas changbaiensis NBRC 104936 TaxID=1219043 RepID=A0A0E9MK87_9SPHN|nr:hypothetical protein [Sphingomonas changbaiensis]GAO38222.1 hypothetical protein SCH01S_10_00320 [Sphingomonas changbaiensis NBRC 104936]
MNSPSRLIAVALLTAPCAAHAVALKTVPAALNPAKAYVLVEYKRVPNPMAGVPFSAKYLPQMGGLSLGRYDPALGDIRGLGKAAANPVADKRGAIEPFQNRPVAKTETSLLYLHEVEPDTYVVMGWANTSFSLGSYTFEAKAGTVTDLGIISAEPDWPKGEEPKPATFGSVFGAALAGPFAKSRPVAPSRVSFRPRSQNDAPLPAALPADRIVPVAFQRGATFGNYLGGMVNRIEGVNSGSAEAPAEAAPTGQ